MAIVVIGIFAYYWVFQVPANFRSELSRLSEKMEKCFELEDYSGARAISTEMNDMLNRTSEE